MNQTTINYPDFPEVIDNSLRKSFVACPQKCFREYFCHWKPALPSIDLHAGKCFATGIETVRKAFWEEKKPEQEALKLGCKAIIEEWGDFVPFIETNKSLDRMVNALISYFQEYGFERDHIKPYIISEQEGKRAIEFSFVIPLKVLHPVTGQPMLYSGRFDQVGVHEESGMVLVEDEKTTTQLGASWGRKWTHSAQFTGYCAGAKQFGIPAQGSLVRGISILKTKFGHAEVIHPIKDWQIARWETQINRDVERMIKCWKERYWDYNLDDACSAYRGCQFNDICLVETPEQQESFLRTNFARRKWDPVTRTETDLED